MAFNFFKDLLEWATAGRREQGRERESILRQTSVDIRV